MIWTNKRASGSGPAAALKMTAAICGLTLLAGCVVTDGAGGGNSASLAGAADGAWSDAGGVATSSLANGRFVSIANDTGNRVAEGTYVYTSAESISLDFFSLLRQTRTRANCVLATPTTLNCTNDTGQQFQLFRRSAVS